MGNCGAASVRGLPQQTIGLPDWLRNKGVQERVYRDHGGGKSPDYNHPQMVLAMERLITAMGRRYNAHPRVAFIQQGLLGFGGSGIRIPVQIVCLGGDSTPDCKGVPGFPNKQLMAQYADGCWPITKGSGSMTMCS